MKHLTFWAFLWHSDEFVSLVNRMVVLASGSAGGWAVARGYLSGEMASMLGVLALVVSHKFSQWNRGRAAAKAAADVAGVAAMAGGADEDPTPSEDAPFVVGRSPGAVDLKTVRKGDTLEMTLTMPGKAPSEDDPLPYRGLLQGNVRISTVDGRKVFVDSAGKIRVLACDGCGSVLRASDIHTRTETLGDFTRITGCENCVGKSAAAGGEGGGA